jgi:hypothetical protein
MTADLPTGTAKYATQGWTSPLLWVFAAARDDWPPERASRGPDTSRRLRVRRHDDGNRFQPGFVAIFCIYSASQSQLDLAYDGLVHEVTIASLLTSNFVSQNRRAWLANRRAWLALSSPGRCFRSFDQRQRLQGRVLACCPDAKKHQSTFAADAAEEARSRSGEDPASVKVERLDSLGTSSHAFLTRAYRRAHNWRRARLTPTLRSPR